MKQAAHELNLSPSAVSHQIKRLERQVAIKLFDRENSQLQLSEVGEEFYSHARELVEGHIQLTNFLKESGQTSRLRLGIPDIYARTTVPSLLQSHSPQDVDIICRESAALIRMWDERRLDCAVFVNCGGAPRGEILGHERLGWYGSKNFDAGSDLPVPLIVQGRGCPYRSRAVTALSNVDRTWHLAGQTYSPLLTEMFVSSGLGVAVRSVRTALSNWKLLDEGDGFPELEPTMLEFCKTDSRLKPRHRQILSDFKAITKRMLIAESSKVSLV